MFPFSPHQAPCPNHPCLPPSHLPSLTLSLCPFIKIYITDYAVTVLSIPPLYALLPCTTPPTSISPFHSCPWVIHISSLASTFPILFLTSPSLFHRPFMLPVSCIFSPLFIFKLCNYDLLWYVLPWVQLLWDNLSFLDFLEVYFICQMGEVLHYVFKYVFK